jgi:uncharacterized protein
MFGAMRLQSLAATNQARLLLGPPNVVRIDPPQFNPPIALDDVARASTLLPGAAPDAVTSAGGRLLNFFESPALDYVLHPIPKETV